MTAVRRRKSLAAVFCAKEENPPVRAVLLRTGEGSYGDAVREKLCGGLAQPEQHLAGRRILLFADECDAAADIAVCDDGHGRDEAVAVAPGELYNGQTAFAARLDDTLLHQLFQLR